jgi:hypothetical protein
MMKKHELKLTEAQLGELFQNNSKKHSSSSDASDCLAATAASSNRLNHLEDLISDHSTAQALKTSLAMKDWSQVMAQSIENTQQSWFKFLGMNTPLRTAFATLSFAFVFAVALPEFSRVDHQEPIHRATPQENMAHDDIINSMKFEDNSDRLSKGSFDYTGDKTSESDSLFGASFG